ncbi:MAG: hypothetical protein F4Z02_09355, partial [Acidimicrobiia bacterium]|nr:hypothetical protein [Acidimicrobiia bacterium]
GQTNAPDGTFTAITAGSSHTCAIKTDKTILCWEGTRDFPAGVSWAG